MRVDLCFLFLEFKRDDRNCVSMNCYYSDMSVLLFLGVLLWVLLSIPFEYYHNDACIRRLPYSFEYDNHE